MKLFFSFFRKKPFCFQTDLKWTRKQAEQWLTEHSFTQYKKDSSIWILKTKELNTFISFCVKIFGDSSFTAAILVSKTLGRSYWCSKEQRVSFKNPFLAIRKAQSFVEKEILNSEDIFNFKKEIVAFSSNRRKWNDSNTSSKFLIM